MPDVPVICASCDYLIGWASAQRVPRMLCKNLECSWPSARANTDRDKKIVKAVKEDNRSASAVAKDFDITRQRIYQILKRS